MNMMIEKTKRNEIGYHQKRLKQEACPNFSFYVPNLYHCGPHSAYCSINDEVTHTHTNRDF